jgi:DNA-binding XRE family transcriptional regulator
VLKAQNEAEGDENMPISIKAARVNAGLTQTEVAERVNKTKNTIASYESYTTVPDIKTAQAMAEVFGMSIDDIVWSQD